MNSPTNLDTLLKEILITPLVGAMIERGIKPAAEIITILDELDRPYVVEVEGTRVLRVLEGPTQEPERESYISRATEIDCRFGE